MRRNSSLTLTLIGWLSWVVLGPAPGWAHPLDPALLELWESGDGAVEVLWRLPLTQPMNASLRLALPDRCREASSPGVSEESGSYLTQRWRIACGTRSLVGERIGVEGLRERKTDALLRVHLADGRVAQAVLRGDLPFFTIPPRAGPLDVVHDYLALGLEHILTGPDHLLFVLGLVLLVRGRRLLWTITAFTLGHSATLSLAVLGFVHIPPRPVEALIACSIFVVAVELTREAQGHTLWVGRVPWAMAFAFGLLHGLGFAGALAQIGLPAHEIPLALVSFNSGIEVGQLLFVGLVLAARAALGLLPAPWPKAGALIPAYTIGSLAAFWVFERVTAIFF